MIFLTKKQFFLLFLIFALHTLCYSETPAPIQTVSETATPAEEPDFKTQFTSEEAEKLAKGEVIIRDKSYINKEGKGVGSCIAFLVINSTKE